MQLACLFFVCGDTIKVSPHSERGVIIWLLKSSELKKCELNIHFQRSVFSLSWNYAGPSIVHESSSIGSSQQFGNCCKLPTFTITFQPLDNVSFNLSNHQSVTVCFFKQKSERSKRHSLTCLSSHRNTDPLQGILTDRRRTRPQGLT